MENCKKLIEKVRSEIPKISYGLFALEEYVLLPYFGGNVILRFTLGREDVTADELDALENELYSLVPEGFLADFMGEVYERTGMSFDGSTERLTRLARELCDEEIPVSPFSEEVGAEARRLLALCGLPEDAPVWEVQPGEDETAILLLGDNNRPIKEFELDGMRYVAAETERVPCEGLMKAAVHARRKGVSLMRFLSKHYIPFLR